MSRLKKFTHSLLSGYLLQGVNVVYTLVSVWLALHYLTKKEFGLWTLVTTIANFNVMFMDLGMSGSLSRILIDHKDDRVSTHYGTLIQTGTLVLLVQGTFMAVAGSIISIWLPQWMKVEEPLQHIFRLLMIFQCVLLGATFAGRMFSFILTAHQRYDMCNYASMGNFAVGLLVLWIGFVAGWGLYSLFIAFLAGSLFSLIFWVWAVWQLGFLPARNRWGRPSRAAFRELFSFGTDIFLMVIGQQLIAASAVPIISRTLGLEAAAIWGIATKVYTLAQQLVYRIFDFSGGALAEMMVRGETERFRKRFADVAIITGLAAAAAGLLLALCNESFLKIWTHGRIAWNPVNDLLMAISFFVYACVRLPINLVVTSKRIGALKYIYFLEGTVFVLLGLLLAPQWGFAGVIVSGVISDFFISGVYASGRAAAYFGIRRWDLLYEWWSGPLLVWFTSVAAALGIWLATRELNAPVQLLTNAICFSAIALPLLWRLGLPKNLNQEIKGRLDRFRAGYFGL
jgi:O-antigen/teichoic acid export membrane protein